jgi:hypothetical protein
MYADSARPPNGRSELRATALRTMAAIPMEWIGHTEREGLPFDVDEFFRRLRESGEQNG